MLQQLLELPGLDCEEGHHPREEEEDGVDPPLDTDQQLGRGHDGGSQAVGQEVGNREGETQGLDRRYHKVLNVNDERKGLFILIILFGFW